MSRVVKAVLLFSIAFAMAGCLPQRGSGTSATVSRIGKEIPIAVRAHDEEEDPIADWGHDHYLVAWQSTRNGPARIYATQITETGTVIQPDGFPLSSSPADQLFPAVAWGEPAALVVWQDLRSRKQWEIYGARVDAAGHLLDPGNIPISIGSGNRRHPMVASDGESFFVVWMQEQLDAGWDILGARVTSEGRLLDPAGIVISRTNGDQTAPDITWTGEHYLVVWMDGRQDAADIYGARIDRDGRLLDPQGIPIAIAAGEQSYPAVASNGTISTVVWIDQRGGANPLVYGARIDGQGTLLDHEGVPLSMTPRLHMFPDIACRAGDCLVIWEEELPGERGQASIMDIVRDVNGVLLTHVTERGTIMLSVPMSFAPKAFGNHFSRVSTDGHRYLVAWKDYRSGIAAGFGRLVEIP